jgi:thymidylate kinase
MFISKTKLEKIKNQSWQEGFDNGRKKAVNETRKVFLKLLTKEVDLGIIDTTKGLNRAIEIIRKGKQ